jgi:hypothetical protein
VSLLIVHWCAAAVLKKTEISPKNWRHIDVMAEALRTVYTNELGSAGYAAHSKLVGKFLRPARTILRQGAAPALDAGQSTQAETIRERFFVDTPRWLVLPDEKDYQKKQLGLEGGAAGLEEGAKLEVLQRIFDPRIARSGVHFVEQYEALRQELAPTIEGFKDMNLTGLEIHFMVSGIVQKCGARGAFERLFKMVRLDPKATIKVKNLEEDPNQVEVVINGDLFSFNLFRGLLSPDTYDSGRLKIPRIFHVVDIGWKFKPHNLVVAAVSQRPLRLPLGMHMCTINVVDVSDPQIFEVGTTKKVEVISGIDWAASQLMLHCHAFIAGLT